MLNHLYGGGLTKPRSNQAMSMEGQFIQFNQAEFISVNALSKNSRFFSNMFSVWSNWMQSTMSLFNPLNYIPTIDWSGFTLPSINLPGSGGSGTTTGTSSTVDPSFDKQGYVYFPRACIQGKICPIHVALHGCQQGYLF